MNIPEYNFSQILHDANVLLIVPPFADVSNSSLAVNILQACAKKEGFSVNIFYANLALASWIGENTYNKISKKNIALGECLFYQSAYFERFNDTEKILKGFEGDLNVLVEVESLLCDWIDYLVMEIFKQKYKVIGCTTGFIQTNAAISFINCIKKVHPEIITIIGGASCQSDLAEGILSLSSSIDYVFSGESEIAFPKFLKNIFQGCSPKNKIIQEETCAIDDIPLPDYSDYIRQLEFFLPESEVVKEKKYQLSYETSRGCWWKAKHSCNFCGLNGNLIYREKSPSRVLNDLDYLDKNYSSKCIWMTDNIMPYSYYNELIPKIIERNYKFEIFYEIKSNVTFEKLILLKKAGITRLQPGIESLSSSLLKRMNKGVFARQNLSLLRNSRSLELNIFWNMLLGFPNDTEKEYREMLSIIPLISHLRPPVNIGPMTIARFSEYYNSPDKFGIKNIQPTIQGNPFPRNNIAKVSTVFDGQYESCFYQDKSSIIQDIKSEVKKWQTIWISPDRAKLKLRQILNGKYLLIDTRGISTFMAITISEKQTTAILLDWPIDSCSGFEKEIAWGLKNKLIIEIDNWYISLVTANPELITELSNIHSKNEDTVKFFQVS